MTKKSLYTLSFTLYQHSSFFPHSIMVSPMDLNPNPLPKLPENRPFFPHFLIFFSTINLKSKIRHSLYIWVITNTKKESIIHKYRKKNGWRRTTSTITYNWGTRKREKKFEIQKRSDGGSCDTMKWF